MRNVESLRQAPSTPNKKLPNMSIWNAINRKILIVAACIALVSVSLSTHAQATTGNIIGDAKTGDTIFLTNPDTGFKRELKISKDGRYQIRNLQAGTYQVVPMHPDGSFDPPQQLDVRAGGTARAMSPSKSGEANMP